MRVVGKNDHIDLNDDGDTVPPEDGRFRVRTKVWTDEDGQQYMVGVAMMGVRPSSKEGSSEDDVEPCINAYATCEEKTVQLQMTLVEWNKLPFFWFVQEGRAPRRISVDLTKEGKN